jgi:hypothetical protein
VTIQSDLFECQSASAVTSLIEVSGVDPVNTTTDKLVIVYVLHQYISHAMCDASQNDQVREDGTFRVRLQVHIPQFP